MSAEGAEVQASDHRQRRDDDLLLLDRILAGDTQAFEELVRRHERRVFRTALAITGSTEDAEEVIQNSFLKVFQHLAGFERSSRFTTWLTRIAVNESLQILRRRKNMQSLDDPEMPGEDVMPRRVEEWHDNPEKLYAAQEIRSIVEEAVRRLPPAYRVVFLLRDIEEMTAEEAAETLGLSVPAIKSRLLRARLMMREELAGRFERPPTFKSRVMKAGMMIRHALTARASRTPGEKGEM